MSGDDPFSRGTDAYREFRPHYPAELFDWLAEAAPARGLAWDCAAGSGQATAGLAARFVRVLASDRSVGQLSEAPPRQNVQALAALAEAAPLASGTVHLVTVAQALHWFDTERFYAEVRRVAAPGALVAVWCYDLLRFDPVLDRRIDHLYHDEVGEYWPAERRLLEAGYRTLPFPFSELAAPPFEMTAPWRLAHLLGYLSTWSAAKRYRAATGEDPIARAAPDLTALWGDPARERRASWALSLRVGRLP